MNKLDQATVAIELDNQDTILLRPTIAAISGISRQLGGHQAALAKVREMDFDAMALIIQLGSGGKGKTANTEARALVASKGTLNLIGDLTDFVLICANGGKSLDDSAADEEASPDGAQGNE